MKSKLEVQKIDPIFLYISLLYLKKCELELVVNGGGRSSGLLSTVPTGPHPAFLKSTSAQEKIFYLLACPHLSLSLSLPAKKKSSGSSLHEQLCSFPPLPPWWTAETVLVPSVDGFIPPALSQLCLESQGGRASCHGAAACRHSAEHPDSPLRAPICNRLLPA